MPTDEILLKELHDAERTRTRKLKQEPTYAS